MRKERDGDSRRSLFAWVDAKGDLHIEGKDAGPDVSGVPEDGERSWEETVVASDVPEVVTLLGGDPGIDVLDLLEEHYTGRASYEFEDRLRDSDIDVDRREE